MRFSKLSLGITLIFVFGIGVFVGRFAGKFVSNPLRSFAPITAAELYKETAEIGQGHLGWLDSMRRFSILNERLKNTNVAVLAKEMVATPLSEDSQIGVQLVLATLTEHDPQLAWKLALSFKSLEVRESALNAVISTIASKDPAHALELSMSLPENQENDLAPIFSNWARQDLEAAKSVAKNLSGRAGEDARGALISYYARKDPQSAWDYVLTFSNFPKEGPDARLEVIQIWAQSDPQSAFQAAISIPESSSRRTAISAVAGAWAFKDFYGALQYAIGIKDTNLRADVLSALSGTVSEHRRELFDALLAYMPRDDHFYNTLSDFFSSWSVANPDEAAGALSKLPSHRAFVNAPAQVASQWMAKGRNKQEVFAWACQLPEGDARFHALQSILKEWRQENLQAASQALNSLKPADRQRLLK